MASPYPRYQKDSKNCYDRSDIWDRQCRPLFEELIRICDLNRIPFFGTACVSNKESGSVYVTDAVGPVAKDIRLKDDRISKHIAVSRGYDIRPPRDEMVVDMDEIVLD